MTLFEEEELASPAPVVDAADVDLEPLLPQRSDNSPEPEASDHLNHPGNCLLKDDDDDDDDDDSIMNAIEPAPQVDSATIENEKADERIPLHNRKKVAVMSPEEASVLSIADLRQRIHDEEQKYYKTDQQTKNGRWLLRQGQFSSKAAVIKGGVEKNLLRKLLPLCYDERDFLSYGEVVRYVYVHGNYIFVYPTDDDDYDDANVDERIPLHVIPISSSGQQRQRQWLVEIEDPKHPDPCSYTISPRPNTNITGEHYATVLLKDKWYSRKILYQFTFDVSSDRGLAKRFVDVVENISKMHYPVNTSGDTIQEAVVISSPSMPSAAAAAAKDVRKESEVTTTK